MANNPWWAPWALINVIEPLMRDFISLIPESAGMKAGQSVLDVCCGTGGLVFLYAETSLTATGIDVDHRVTKIAGDKLRKTVLSNASFQTASALQMPFKDNTFDHVSITLAIHEVERSHRDTIISEMKRVVKQQGNLVFLDYMSPLPRAFNSWLARFTEFIAGRDHFRSFNDYQKQGGLMALIEKHHLYAQRKNELCPLEIVVAQSG